MRGRIEGVITALVTPFNQEGEVDEEALRGLVDFQVKSGVDGFYPCGTAGEGMIMSLEQRRKVAEVVIDQVGGRVPIIVHVGAADTAAVVELARHSEKVGADALGVVTPYYYPLDDEALIEHYRKVAEVTKLPIFVYNIPHRTMVNVTPDLLARMCEAIPNIAGVKDSSRDFSLLLDYIDRLPKDKVVICGTDGLFIPAMIMGCKGAISAISNVFPELFVEAYKALKEGEYPKAVKLQFKINIVRRILSKPYIAALKEALKIRGIYAGTVRRPLRPCEEAEAKLICNALARLELMD